MDKLSDFISKKNNNNIIQFKLGNIKNNTFYSNLSDEVFDQLFNNIKSKNNHKIENKLYNTYYDHDNIYSIYNNGFEKHYRYLLINKTNMKLGNTYDLECSIINCRRLPRDSFELKDKYDKILHISSVCLDYNEYIVEFNRIVDDFGQKQNEISVIINDKNANIDFLWK